MKSHMVKLGGLLATLLLSFNINATGWNATTHDLAVGDVNNDSRDDLLYIAKDAASKSGIVLADASGDLTILHQEWNSNHLALPWHSSNFKPYVGDFNGDGHADVFLKHKSTGHNYLLHSDDEGKFVSTTQKTQIKNNYHGLNWSDSKVVVGDYNGDDFDDIYLQPKSASVSSRIIYGDSVGKFTAIGDTWSNDHLNLHWSQNDAVVYAGDFNGDGKDDLLVQAKPDWVMIPYSDLIIPVQRFEEQANGIVFAHTDGKISTSQSTDFWDTEFANLNR